MNGKEIGQEITHCFNFLNTEEDACDLVNVLINEHRTIQQKITGDVIIRFVKSMSKNFRDGNYDARNEYACLMCNIMWKALKNKFPKWFTDDMPTKLPNIK